MAARQSSEPGVNAMRFDLMFTVVMAHAWWLFGLPLERSFATFLLLVTAQSSVPAFFITSGYFLRWREGSPFAVTGTFASPHFRLSISHAARASAR